MQFRLSREHYLPILLAIQTMLGLFQLLDVLDIVFFPMIHRMNIKSTFDLGFSLIIPILVLMLLWIFWVISNKNFKLFIIPFLFLLGYPLLGIDLAITLSSLSSIITTTIYLEHRSLYIYWLIFLYSIIELFSLLHWLYLPLNVSTQLSYLAILDLNIFYIISNLVPPLAIIFLYMWILTPLFSRFNKKMVEPKNNNYMKYILNHKHLLILSMVIGIISALYPYSHNINPNMTSTGVDAKRYIAAVEYVQENIVNAFTVLEGSRPFLFINIYLLQNVFRFSTSNIIKYLPLILNPLFIFSSYVLTLESFNNKNKASFAAFLTSCGYQITVNMYSYYLANMLGLSLAFFSIGFLFRAIKNDKKIPLFISCMFSTALLYTHPWAFDLYYVTILLTTLYLCYRYYHFRNNKKDIYNLMSFIIVVGIIILIKSFFSNGVDSFNATSNLLTNTSTLTNFWVNSIYSFRLYYGGLLSVFLIYILGIFGYKELKIQNIPDLFFIVFMFISSLIFLIGNEAIKSRILFNIPIGIFASLGLASLLLRIKMNIKINEIEYQNLFMFFTILYFLTYLFRSLANLL